jgi:hypothetical protein
VNAHSQVYVGTIGAKNGDSLNYLFNVIFIFLEEVA